MLIDDAILVASRLLASLRSMRAAQEVVDEAERQVIAREAGLNRYERINGHDFSAGDAYWERTKPFWALVRDAWDEVMDKHDRFRLQTESEEGKLFEKFFERAEAIESADEFDDTAARDFIDRTLAEHITAEADATEASRY
ncbi:DUF6607 family protein [Halomonas sp.]|uniref:DUF6607 family protein n=1 Tax=Halomonas sp. TaxID=1486246 RepID=UPI00384DDC77